MEADFVYFNRRAAEEKAAASCAEHPNARQAHLDLARRYQDLADAIAGAEQPPSLRIATSA